ncbi:MAG: M48 family peptidase, partial [Cyclobacteriaceae bacterium]
MISEKTIFIALLAIITADFILERVLAFLNSKSAKSKIPNELEGIYDEEKYAKSQAYHRESGRFSLWSATFSFVLTFCAIYFGWFGELDSWLRTFSPFEPVTTLLFFGVLFILSDLIGTPFSIYSTFVIEEKYGFNKTTIKTYLVDKLKGYLLTIIIGGLLLRS